MKLDINEIRKRAGLVVEAKKNSSAMKAALKNAKAQLKIAYNNSPEGSDEENQFSDSIRVVGEMVDDLIAGRNPIDDKMRD